MQIDAGVVWVHVLVVAQSHDHVLRGDGPAGSRFVVGQLRPVAIEDMRCIQRMQLTAGA